MKTYLIVAYSLFIANLCAMSANELYKYDPSGWVTEAIVFREHSGLKEYLSVHRDVPSIQESLKEVDTYGRSIIHYAAMIEDTEFYELLREMGCSVTEKDYFGYTAEDYINKRHYK